MEKPSGWKSEVFEFDDGEGGRAKAVYAVEYEVRISRPAPKARQCIGSWVVSQHDLDENGVRWNCTPCRSFRTREQAVEWALAEIAGLTS